LTPEEQAGLLTLRQSHPEVNQTYDLVQQFAQILRTRTGEQLDTWLTKVAESRIPELQSFLLGIERDTSAVAAGLTLPHSNGIGDWKDQQIKASETHGIWEGRIPTPASTGVTSALATCVLLIRYTSACSKQTHQRCARLGEVDKCSTDLLYFDQYQWGVFCEKYRMPRPIQEET
jgi:hypothetical protein